MFEGVFTIYGLGGLLGHVTLMQRTNLRSPYPKRLHIKFALIGPAVSEKMFEHCERRTTDGPCVFYKLPCEPLA